MKKKHYFKLKIKEFVKSLDHVSLIGALMLISRRIIGTNNLTPEQKRKANIAIQEFIESITYKGAEGFAAGLKK